MESAAGRRELTKNQNRQIILEAARRVFAEIGFGAATVRDIIRATSLASGTFYNYFKSKEEVYQALREEIALTVWLPLHGPLGEAATAEAFLSISFRGFFDFVAANRMDFRHLRPAADNRFRADRPEMMAGFAELRAGLEAAIARGLFAAVDADFLMAAIIGVAFEMAERMLQREPVDAAAAAAFATALLLGGIPALPMPNS